MLSCVTQYQGAVMAEPSRTSYPRAVDRPDTVTEAVQDAKAKLDERVEDLSRRGREAVQGAKDVWSALGDALETSIRTRPYTTLAVAGFIGFLYGATRRR
jgi:ElaB/YqjD/DUF883 family membrane-anchored ribosome-binding protein